MNLQPSEFIAKTQATHIQHGPRHCRTPQEPHLCACRCYKGASPVDTRHEQFAARMRVDTDTDTDTSTDKENNND